MIIRRIADADGDLLRSVRLQALADSPHAFASTHAQESVLSAADWERRARRDADGTDSAAFLAIEGGDPVGMAGGFTPQGRSDERHLWGMWVAPKARNRGVGRALAGVVIDWATEGGANRVTLWLAEDNEAASGLYQRLGFIDTGRHQPLPSHPGTMEQFLRLEIARPAPQ